jgi:hypothetical protein
MRQDYVKTKPKTYQFLPCFSTCQECRWLDELQIEQPEVTWNPRPMALQ